VRPSYMLPVLLAAVPALGQPAPAPPAPGPSASACAVTIVRAPDPVRQTIERWLANEHCTLALQVRIIPTEGGLYLLATDEHGRVRERIVPDAQSAGVLIASWAADDGLGGATPPPEAAIAPGPVVAPPPPAGYGPPPAYGAGPAYGGAAYGPSSQFNTMSFHPPGAYADEGPIAPPPVVHPTKLITLGAGFGANSSGGLRLDLDFMNRNGWTIGGLIGLTGSTMSIYDYSSSSSGYYDASMTDFAFALTAGHITRWGDWHLRGNIGLGIVASSMHLEGYNYNSNTYSSGDGSVASAYVEANLMLGHSIGSTKVWELEMGPVLSYAKQNWYLQDQMQDMIREAGNAMFVVGLRHGL